MIDLNEEENNFDSGTASRYYSLEEYRKIKGFILVHFNAGNLNKLKFIDIKANIISPNTSALCLSETWFNPRTDMGDYLLDGFKYFRQDRNPQYCKSSGGGLITYIRDDLIADDKCYEHLNLNIFEIECQFICIKKKHCKDIVIVNCYRCPENKTIESRNIAIDKISNNIKLIPNYQQKQFIINGDLNLNTDSLFISDDSNAVHTSDYVDKLCNTFNLNNFISDHTCFRNDSATTIDLILSNMNHISEHGVLDYIQVEHRPVFICKRRQHDKIDNISVFIRPVSKIDNILLADELLNINWDEIKSNDIDLYWDNLKSTLVNICNKICPLKKTKIKKDLPCWYLNDLAHLRYERDRLGKDFRLDRKNREKKEAFKKAAKVLKIKCILLKGITHWNSFRNTKMIQRTFGKNFINFFRKNIDLCLIAFMMILVLFWMEQML